MLNAAEQQGHASAATLSSAMRSQIDLIALSCYLFSSTLNWGVTADW
jgi:hypothetical protein